VNDLKHKSLLLGRIINWDQQLVINKIVDNYPREINTKVKIVDSLGISTNPKVFIHVKLGVILVYLGVQLQLRICLAQKVELLRIWILI
jgi:hypothetical protein